MTELSPDCAASDDTLIEDVADEGIADEMQHNDVHFSFEQENLNNEWVEMSNVDDDTELAEVPLADMTSVDVDDDFELTEEAPVDVVRKDAAESTGVGKTASKTDIASGDDEDVDAFIKLYGLTGMPDTVEAAILKMPGNDDLQCFKMIRTKNKLTLNINSMEAMRHPIFDDMFTWTSCIHFVFTGGRDNRAKLPWAAKVYITFATQRAMDRATQQLKNIPNVTLGKPETGRRPEVSPIKGIHPDCILAVKNFGSGVKEEKLRPLFPDADIYILSRPSIDSADAIVGLKGFAYLVYDTPEEAEEALKARSARRPELNGRKLLVMRYRGDTSGLPKGMLKLSERLLVLRNVQEIEQLLKKCSASEQKDLLNTKLNTLQGLVNRDNYARRSVGLLAPTYATLSKVRNVRVFQGHDATTTLIRLMKDNEDELSPLETGDGVTATPESGGKSSPGSNAASKRGGVKRNVSGTSTSPAAEGAGTRNSSASPRQRQASAQSRSLRGKRGAGESNRLQKLQGDKPPKSRNGLLGEKPRALMSLPVSRPTFPLLPLPMEPGMHGPPMDPMMQGPLMGPFPMGGPGMMGPDVMELGMMGPPMDNRMHGPPQHMPLPPGHVVPLLGGPSLLGDYPGAVHGGPGPRMNDEPQQKYARFDDRFEGRPYEMDDRHFDRERERPPPLMSDIRPLMDDRSDPYRRDDIADHRGDTGRQSRFDDVYGRSRSPFDDIHASGRPDVLEERSGRLPRLLSRNEDQGPSGGRPVGGGLLGSGPNDIKAVLARLPPVDDRILGDRLPERRHVDDADFLPNPRSLLPSATVRPLFDSSEIEEMRRSGKSGSVGDGRAHGINSRDKSGIEPVYDDSRRQPAFRDVSREGYDRREQDGGRVMGAVAENWNTTQGRMVDDRRGFDRPFDDRRDFQSARSSDDHRGGYDDMSRSGSSRRAYENERAADDRRGFDARVTDVGRSGRSNEPDRRTVGSLDGRGQHGNSARDILADVRGLRDDIGRSADIYGHREDHRDAMARSHGGDQRGETARYTSPGPAKRVASPVNAVDLLLNLSQLLAEKLHRSSNVDDRTGM